MKKRRKFLASEDDEKTLSAPTMARSRNQLGTAYAPGAFFTFEGGLGACISIPDLSASIDNAAIRPETKAQIILRLQEVWQSWFARAYSVGTSDRQIDPHQCLDEALLSGASAVPLAGDRLAFLSPLRMGYAPAPLTFVCNKCQLFKRFESASDLAKNIGALRNNQCTAAGATGPCQWRQLDVVFVHWSGEWMPATPGRWEWNSHTDKTWLYGEECTVCGGKAFKLNTDSPRIGQWHFYCANPTCGHKGSNEWRQNDRFTTGVFRDHAGVRIGERRMEPISYRASSAYYPQAEQFVLFPETEHKLITLLEPQMHAELAAFIAAKFQFGGAELTPDEMKEALLAAGKSDEWQSYENFMRMRGVAESSADAKGVDLWDNELKKLVKRWTTSEPPLIRANVDLPSEVIEQLERRTEYTSRFDPFVLAVEHEALNRGKLSATPDGGRSPFVRFSHLDNDLAPKGKSAKLAQEAETQRLMDKLGLDDLGLIREFDLCRFTHGYTRVSAAPTFEKRSQDMPVRLRLFDPLRNGKRRYTS